MYSLMIGKAFTMSVHPDAHSEYERRHNPIWKELEDTLIAHGVFNYSIFLDPQSSELFAYAESESEERWQSMRDLLPANPDHSPKSVELREVFHLESKPS